MNSLFCPWKFSFISEIPLNYFGLITGQFSHENLQFEQHITLGCFQFFKIINDSRQHPLKCISEFLFIYTMVFYLFGELYDGSEIIAASELIPAKNDSQTIFV